MSRILRSPAVLMIASLLTPQMAHAQASEFRDIVLSVTGAVTPLIGFIAVLAIVILGIRMVSSPDDSAMASMKTAMAAIITGLFFTILTPTIVRIFYDEQVATDGGGTGILNNQDAVRLELLGIAEWFQALAVIIGVVTIIITAFRAIASFGNEGSVSAAKKQVLYGIIGLLVVIFSNPIFFIFGGAEETGLEETFFDMRRPNALIFFIFYYVNILLRFLLTIMVAILIYAGMVLVLNMGDDSRVEQAKGIVIRSVIGLVLILFSMAIVGTILWFFSEDTTLWNLIF